MIHPSSIIEDGAKIDSSVEIGPFCYVGSNVTIGKNCKLIGHCNINGHTTIGENNKFYPFSSIGQCGQDYSANEKFVSYVKIGNDNIFREGSTVHAGTKEGTITKIGNHCMFMNSSHVGHNCQVGNNVILVGLSELGGYVEVCDNAIISGCCAIHQFCRVGRFAMVSGGSVFSKDVPPFMIVEGRNLGAKGINLVGLQRNGFTPEVIRIIKNMFKIYYTRGLAPYNAVKVIAEELPQIPEVLEFLEFCKTSKKGVVVTRKEYHRN